MNKKIQLLSLVSYQFLPPKMGGQKGIALFYHYFSKYVNLTCVTIKNNDISYSNGYEILNILSNSKIRYIYLPYFFALRKIIKQKEITHLIIEHPYYGWLGWLLKKFLKVKLIVHSHNIEGLRFRSMNKWWWHILWQYEKWAHRKADINFFITDEDRGYAITHFGLHVEKCFTVTYGVELDQAPSSIERHKARKIIESEYQIAADEKILLFNGTLNYKPNLDAVDIILTKINPILLLAKNFEYKIIICGKNLPADYKGLKDYEDKNIIFAGFVDDITLFFKAADIFINPVNDGGGIKTKLVEALGYNMDVVTTKSGAIGISKNITGDKMKIEEHNNWEKFAQEIIRFNNSADIPKEFFEYFYWGNIAEKCAAKL